MSIEIGYSSMRNNGFAAGTGIAATAGGSIGGVGVQNAAVTQASDQVATDTNAADLDNPESYTQYSQRDLANRLPPKQIYAIPCCWGDVLYWMDS